MTKLKYLKPHCIEGKVMSAEWQKIKQQGNPPCGRVGHTMTFLPLNQALVIVGGRNDEVCKNLNTPFLDDIHLFLLDQKAWVSVKYTPASQRLYRLGNHCMATMSDFEGFEKTVVFGGITHSKISQSFTAASAKKDLKIIKKESVVSARGQMPLEKSPVEPPEEKDPWADVPESSHLSNDLYCLEIR